MADTYATQATGSYRTIQLPADELEQSFSWNPDGTVAYIEVEYVGYPLNTYQPPTNNVTYRQTFSYTSGKITAISQWVPQ